MNNTEQTTIDALKIEEDRLKDEIRELKKDLTNLKKLSSNAPNRESQITDCEDEIADKKKLLKEIKTAIVDRRAAAKAVVREEIIEKAKEGVKQWLIDTPSAAYINASEKYPYRWLVNSTKCEDKQNVVQESESPAQFQNYILDLLGLPTTTLSVVEIRDIFSQNDRWFAKEKYTVDPSNWQVGKNYFTLSHYEPFFITNEPRVYDKNSSKHAGIISAFNDLMYSVSGGKTENQNHIEQWVLHKVIHYKKIINTPELVIIGDSGSEGKGIFATIVKKLFPSGLTEDVKVDVLTSKFNSQLEGKLLLHFDEGKLDDDMYEALKRQSQNATFITEAKFEKQKTIEKCFTGLWTSNSLPFPLMKNGGADGVDRRFSVLTTNIRFVDSIKKGVHASKTLTQIIDGILYNRKNIALWFQYLQTKHPQVMDPAFVLEALHGEDYHRLAKQNQDVFDQVWDKFVMPRINAGEAVPYTALSEILRLEGEKDTPSELKEKITKAIDKLKGKHNLVYDSSRVNIISRNTTRRVQVRVIRADANKKNLTFNWATLAKSNYPQEGQSTDNCIVKEDLLFDLLDVNEDDDEVIAQTPQVVKSTKLTALLESLNDQL